jgi:alginate O-acetyltransferase complex protein AlgI
VLFSGLLFLLGFLPITLAGYGLISRCGETWAKVWLISASLVFYTVGGRAFVVLLIFSVFANYLLLCRMHGSSRAGAWSAAGVVLNLLPLCWFKYATLDPMPPLGLSFFTFSQIGCLLHHAVGDREPPRFRDYALFVVFFPALLAGPILNPHETLPQFARTGGWRLAADNLAVGFGFFLIGLLKKTLLASHLLDLVADGFADPARLSLLPAWQAAAAYSLQLYFDFSGYSDMAVGLAWMFGLRFPDNFERPYRASSIIGYWQCWHMSLTRFLMANVHAPLTMAVLRWRRDRRLAIDQAAQRTLLGFLCMIAMPVTVTMMLVSLWHGAASTFLAFGALHTAFLLANHAWRLFRAPTFPRIAGIALTYLGVLVASVVFRAPDLTTAVSLLAGMAGMHGTAIDPQPDVHLALDTAWILGLYAIVWFAPSTRQMMLGGRIGPFGDRSSTRWAVAMGCAATIGLLATGGGTEFLYFRF